MLPQGEILVADACFLYDYYYSTNTTFNNNLDSFHIQRMKEVKNFADKLSENNNIIAIPAICQFELMQTSERDILGKENPKLKKEMMQNTTLILKAHEHYEAIISTLQEDPLFYIEDIPAINLKDILLTANTNNLKVRDALYILYAKENEINNIITVDKDFVRIKEPNITIYIDTHNYNKLYKNNTSKLKT
jgi:predicted nucleic acid-binding protein